MKKTMLQHSGAFLITVFLAVLLLLLGACLPQAPIDRHVRSSAEVMARERDYPVMADRSFASILDYVTDALILMESKSTSIADPETILPIPSSSIPRKRIPRFWTCISIPWMPVRNPPNIMSSIGWVSGRSCGFCFASLTITRSCAIPP